jgi:hypothetical protein
MRLDSVPVENVRLNLKCRDSIIPVLRALQHLYCDRELTDDILQLIGNDINDNTRTDTGREGMDYWHICVLLAVRLGCDYTYDQLQDLAENHRSLRAIMGLGDYDETEFHNKTIRNNFCLLRPQTIEQISRAIVREGHKLQPDAIEKVRADSFVMETNIHYPTESSLLYDGLRRIISLCAELRQAVQRFRTAHAALQTWQSESAGSVWPTGSGLRRCRRIPRSGRADETR